MKDILKINLEDIIDKKYFEVLKEITGIFVNEGYKYFLVGAHARDIILNGILGKNIEPIRTKDIDFGIYIEDWDEYEKIIKILTNDYSYSETSDPYQVKRGNLIIDLIPFGNIADKDGIIKGRKETTIAVQGFEEAFQNSIKINFKENKNINVLSIEGFVLLKLFAWRDKKLPQHLRDLVLVINNYKSEAFDELYINHINLLSEGLDIDLLYMRILGRNISKILKNSLNIKKQIFDFINLEINKENHDSNFIITLVSLTFMNTYKEAENCLVQLLKGISE